MGEVGETWFTVSGDVWNAKGSGINSRGQASSFEGRMTWIDDDNFEGTFTMHGPMLEMLALFGDEDTTQMCDKEQLHQEATNMGKGVRLMSTKLIDKDASHCWRARGSRETCAWCCWTPMRSKSPRAPGWAVRSSRGATESAGGGVPGTCGLRPHGCIGNGKVERWRCATYYAWAILACWRCPNRFGRYRGAHQCAAGPVLGGRIW